MRVLVTGGAGYISSIVVRTLRDRNHDVVLVERMLPWFGRRYRLRYAALRYFNAAGALADGSLGENWDHATCLVPV